MATKLSNEGKQRHRFSQTILFTKCKRITQKFQETPINNLYECIQTTWLPHTKLNCHQPQKLKLLESKSDYVYQANTADALV